MGETCSVILVLIYLFITPSLHLVSPLWGGGKVLTHTHTHAHTHTRTHTHAHTHTQVHVSRIHVAGLQRTKNDIVVEQVKDILHATSLQDLLMRSLEALQRLQELNTFKHVDIQLDTVKGEGRRREGVEVMFVVEEYGWLASTIAANAGTQSGDAVRERVCMCVCVCVSVCVGVGGCLTTWYLSILPESLCVLA